MANNAKGLGKGLAALLGDNVMDTGEEKGSLYLPISQVESCAAQPRKQFDPDALADLADSIRELQGYGSPVHPNTREALSYIQREIGGTIE